MMIFHLVKILTIDKSNSFLDQATAALVIFFLGDDKINRKKKTHKQLTRQNNCTNSIFLSIFGQLNPDNLT